MSKADRAADHSPGIAPAPAREPRRRHDDVEGSKVVSVLTGAIGFCLGVVVAAALIVPEGFARLWS